MNMVKNKLIFIILAGSSIVVKSYLSCERQLADEGFDMDSDETDAFMHAFFNLCIPKVNPPKRGDPEYTTEKKESFYSYFYELIKIFLKDHEKNIEFMYLTPKDWCSNDGRKNKYSKRASLKYTDVDFIEMSREDALFALFMLMKENSRARDISPLQKEYMKYVGKNVKEFVQYTSARSPSDYCNNKQSPPTKHIVYNKETCEWEEIEADTIAVETLMSFKEPSLNNNE